MITGGADPDESLGEIPEAVRERIEAGRYCATFGIEVVNQTDAPGVDDELEAD